MEENIELDAQKVMVNGGIFWKNLNLAKTDIILCEKWVSDYIIF